MMVWLLKPLSDIAIAHRYNQGVATLVDIGAEMAEALEDDGIFESCRQIPTKKGHDTVQSTIFKA